MKQLTNDIFIYLFIYNVLRLVVFHYVVDAVRDRRIVEISRSRRKRTSERRSVRRRPRNTGATARTAQGWL